MGNCYNSKTDTKSPLLVPKVVTRPNVATNPLEDRAQGCILGALCGDAIGVPVKAQTFVNPDEAQKCLGLPGGGPFKLGKGQVTDAGELTLSLGQALVAGRGALDLNKIGEQYYRWYETGPFDAGIAMKNALIQAGNVKENQSQRMRVSSLESRGSQTNTALMRITPLCVWASKLNRDDLIRAVREETRLTHPNMTAQNASIAYAYTVSHLLNNPGQHLEAYQKCKEIVEFLDDDVLRGWLDEIEKDKLMLADENSASIKIGWIYSMCYLKKNTKYEEGIINVLRKGGNTDANCCIVGGMLGALHGASGIPERIVVQVLNFNAETDGGIKRPDFLTPRICAEEIIKRVIEIRPSVLNVGGAESEMEKSRI